MYPTKEKILEKKIKFKKETINQLKLWIKTTWRKTKTNKDKRIALVKLIKSLNQIYNNNVKITFYQSSCHYKPKTHTINICAPLSIISTLHEFAHSVFGADETIACRWSVQLFKLIAPRSFNNLTWKGHMLIKK